MFIILQFIIFIEKKNFSRFLKSIIFDRIWQINFVIKFIYAA